MRISKTYLSIVSASLIQGTVLAVPDIEGTFVQDENGTPVINPIFQPEIINQLHYLIKRSYRITDRQGNAYNYRHPDKLTHQRSNSFSNMPRPIGLRARSGSGGDPNLHCDKWTLHEPFTGIHGANTLSGLPGVVPKIPLSVELDYPGFVAYLPREDERPPLIAVVFRGSQSKSFQPLGGILGPSWLTNFSATKGEFPEGIKDSEELAGTLFHEGYLRKYLSARINILAHIETMFHKVPESDRINTRIIITGHSQGAGIALPAALDITHVLGKKFFGEAFNNKETPRFFVYALSGPNTTGDARTKELMNTIVGRDNIVRHNSLFDIITYACPGKYYDSEFYKFAFGSIAGVATGYHPVGHLAIDDIRSLIIRGFRYNNKELSDETFARIWEKLEEGYSKAIRKRQLKYRSMRPIHSFYLSIKEFLKFSMAAREADGLYFFACINHYGSSTANICCAPKTLKERSDTPEPPSEAMDTPRSLLEVIDTPRTPRDETADTPRTPRTPREGMSTPRTPRTPREGMETTEALSHESSFEPRLPETHLDPCLRRGAFVRKLVKERKSFKNLEQIFDPDFDPVEFDCDGYESDSESSGAGES